tara:strand:+ start:803 stop:1456 length:654 start_codon:yes stop_codon:yes gene_type:complete
MGLPKPPFEDGIFITVYRNILLRPIYFCDAVGKNNIKKCISMTNKFSQSAIQSAYAIYLSELSPDWIIVNTKNQYDQQKCTFYFYIVYRELFRRKHPSASQFLSLVEESYQTISIKNVFRSFNHQLAWDYVLMFLAQEKLTSEIFMHLWFRYKNSLLSCEPNVYNDFIVNQYFDNPKEYIEVSSVKATDSQFDFFIQRAEKFYQNSNIFGKNNSNFK